ncbi:hypothetical protein Cgig2_022458 [Carnegiea gigantea]|uniref:Uncharacterized protein n=1 Tax=Carnegiea gigantea TaxID=171969 RepID=A0A9Q1QF74_9CARY|nr:hypothetical protein Cgig2_022458 [Carnegiea gigantea]
MNWVGKQKFPERSEEQRKETGEEAEEPRGSQLSEERAWSSKPTTQKDDDIERLRPRRRRRSGRPRPPHSRRSNLLNLHHPADNLPCLVNPPPDKAPLHPPRRDGVRPERDPAEPPNRDAPDHPGLPQPERADRGVLRAARRVRVVPQPAGDVCNSHTHHVPGPQGRHRVVPLLVRQQRSCSPLPGSLSPPGSERRSSGISIGSGSAIKFQLASSCHAEVSL